MLKQLLTDLREEVPGVDIEVEQPLAHLISHMLSGVNAQIAIKVHGDDLDTLLATAERIKAAIAERAGRDAAGDRADPPDRTSCTSACGPTTWPATA